MDVMEKRSSEKRLIDLTGQWKKVAEKLYALMEEMNDD